MLVSDTLAPSAADNADFAQITESTAATETWAQFKPRYLASLAAYMVPVDIFAKVLKPTPEQEAAVDAATLAHRPVQQQLHDFPVTNYADLFDKLTLLNDDLFDYQETGAVALDDMARIAAMPTLAGRDRGAFDAALVAHQQAQNAFFKALENEPACESEEIVAWEAEEGRTSDNLSDAHAAVMAAPATNLAALAEKLAIFHDAYQSDERRRLRDFAAEIATMEAERDDPSGRMRREVAQMYLDVVALAALPPAAGDRQAFDAAASAYETAFAADCRLSERHRALSDEVEAISPTPDALKSDSGGAYYAEHTLDRLPEAKRAELLPILLEWLPRREAAMAALGLPPGEEQDRLEMVTFDARRHAAEAVFEMQAPDVEAVLYQIRLAIEEWHLEYNDETPDDANAMSRLMAEPWREGGALAYVYRHLLNIMGRCTPPARAELFDEEAALLRIMKEWRALPSPRPDLRDTAAWRSLSQWQTAEIEMFLPQAGEMLNYVIEQRSEAA